MKQQTKQPSIKDDPDMQRSLPALIRAVKRAHKIAHLTGTLIVTFRDGRVIKVPPKPEFYNDNKIKLKIG